MGDIEIGIKIDVNLYLLVSEDLPRVPFNIDYIENIEKTEFGTKVYYKESKPFMSKYDVLPYDVLDCFDDVNEAFENAIKYKASCLETIANQTE